MRIRFLPVLVALASVVTLTSLAAPVARANSGRVPAIEELIDARQGAQDRKYEMGAAEALHLLKTTMTHAESELPNGFTRITLRHALAIAQSGTAEAAAEILAAEADLAINAYYHLDQSFLEPYQSCGRCADLSAENNPRYRDAVVAFVHEALLSVLETDALETFDRSGDRGAQFNTFAKNALKNAAEQAFEAFRLAGLVAPFNCVLLQLNSLVIASPGSWRAITYQAGQIADELDDMDSGRPECTTIIAQTSERKTFRAAERASEPASPIELHGARAKPSTAPKAPKVTAHETVKYHEPVARAERHNWKKGRWTYPKQPLRLSDVVSR